LKSVNGSVLHAADSNLATGLWILCETGCADPVKSYIIKMFDAEDPK